jgi:anaerobic magnesium-protoporphyrin IX monomethyl ester cyclase
MPATKGLVVLYVPHYVDPRRFPLSADYMATPPLPYLALGTPLRAAGYDVRIIDAKWEQDPLRLVADAARDAVALGVTGLTGYAVRDGLLASAAAKAANPALPVVWGGWHSSWAARQAVEDDRVDVVVKGQGERSFPEVLDALREGRALDGIAGIVFRGGDGRPREMPDRPPEDMNRLPPPAYDLVDVSRYVRVGPGPLRHANLICSRGCPFHCDFCLDSRNKWFGLSLARMEEELKFWVLGHGVNSVRFYDGNFFMGRDRLLDIARMINGGEMAGRFAWTATGVAKRLLHLDGPVLDELKTSGCHQVAIGAESGSDELLAQITNKTTVEETTEAVRLLTRHGINQYLFFMVGYPDEPEDTLGKTLGLIARLKAINPWLELQLNFCVPLPGSVMFKKAIEKGLFTEPRRFEDWAEQDVSRPNLPHITPDYTEKVRRFMRYLLLAYPQRHRRNSLVSRVLDHPVARLAYEPLRRAARWRIERQAFGMPVEALLYDGLRSLRARRLAPRAAAS